MTQQNNEPTGPYLVLYRNSDSPRSYFVENATSFEDAITKMMERSSLVNGMYDLHIAEYVPLRIIDGRNSNEYHERKFNEAVRIEYAKLYDEYNELVEQYETKTGKEWRHEEAT